VNAQAVATCDKEHLGFLLDPFRCDYDPAKDAGALCAGTSVDGVIGSNADTASCLTAKALAIDKIWYGATSDGSYEPNPSSDVRTGKLGPRSCGGPTRGRRYRWPDHEPGHRPAGPDDADAGYASAIAPAIRPPRASSSIRRRRRETSGHS
jgi:feruloyl esterase